MFDTRRRCCLYLTWWTDGETRRRGPRSPRSRTATAEPGVEFAGTELPDFLPAVLEFAATADLAGGLALLQDHRPGIELLRLALLDAATPYAAPVEAVCALLPGPSPADVAAAKALARTGPAARAGRARPFARGAAPPPAGGPRDEPGSTCCCGASLPYVMLAVLVGGTIWRYRYDKFGWTTRSSQLYESRLLRIGSPLFHFGLLV